MQGNTSLGPNGVPQILILGEKIRSKAVMHPFVSSADTNEPDEILPRS